MVPPTWLEQSFWVEVCPHTWVLGPQSWVGNHYFRVISQPHMDQTSVTVGGFLGPAHSVWFIICLWDEQSKPWIIPRDHTWGSHIPSWGPAWGLASNPFTEWINQSINDSMSEDIHRLFTVKRVRNDLNVLPKEKQFNVFTQPSKITWLRKVSECGGKTLIK